MTDGEVEPSLALRRSTLRGWAPETPEVLTRQELESWFPGELDFLIGLGIESGAMVLLDDNLVELKAPVLLSVFRDLFDLGFQLTEIAMLQSQISHAADLIGSAFSEILLGLPRVWLTP